MLTALRLNEVADGAWTELHNDAWIIPSQRMKGRNGKARAHALLLTDEIKKIIDALPRVGGGKFMFSTSLGAKPVWISDKIKKRIDARMLRTLKALARTNGEDVSIVTLPHWQNHDIRHTIRTRLSKLKISEEAREAVLAHARPGIKGVYDHYDYFEEKREALELWAAALRTIVEPAPSNVIKLERRR